MKQVEENYYTNAEVARLANVSKTTVKNWIDRSEDGSYELELTLINDKNYISKTDKNYKLFLEYKSKGFKYKSNIDRKVIKPNQKFIREFSKYQLIELNKGLSERGEIDLKFVYLDGGADKWNDFYMSIKDDKSSSPYSYDTLLLSSFETIETQFGGKKINIIDITSGNGLPLRNFSTLTHKKDILNSYTSIDISGQACDLSINNIESLGLGIPTHHYKCDIELFSFEDFIYDLDKLYPETINVFFLIGGTLGNFVHPEIVLNNIQKSMNKEDLFFISNKYPAKNNISDLKPHYTKENLDHRLFAIRSLGIEVDQEDLTLIYNKSNNMREMFAKLQSNYTLEIEIEGKNEVIELEKGSSIKIWQHKLLDLHDIDTMLDKTSLRLNLYVLSSDNKYMLLSYKKL